jgi:hypothetical protein
MSEYSFSIDADHPTHLFTFHRWSSLDHPNALQRVRSWNLEPSDALTVMLQGFDVVLLQGCDVVLLQGCDYFALKEL